MKVNANLKKTAAAGLLTAGFLLLTLTRDKLFFYVSSGGEKVFLGAEFLVTLLLFLAVLFVVFFGGLVKREENRFLILALAGGVAFAFVTPLCQECDGLIHLYRALDVSYGNVFGSFADLTHESGVVRIPANLAEIRYQVFGPYSGLVADYQEGLKQLCFSPETVLYELKEPVISFYFWAQGLGLFLGRILHMSVYAETVLCHLLNLCVYIVPTYFAVKKMPVCRKLFLALALFPLMLYQAASFSPDALLNGLSLLFTALCFNYAYGEKQKVTRKDALLLGCILAVIFMCKYVYVCLGLLVFLIPVSRFNGRKNWLLCAGIGLIPLAVIGGLVSLNLLRTIAEKEQEMAAAAVSETTQIGFILSSPVSYAGVLFNTVRANAETYVRWMGCLGSLNYPIDLLTLLGPLCFVVLGVLDTNTASRQISVRDRIWILFIAGVTVVGLFTALYVGDASLNEVGGALVVGLQGRYFFPVLILPFVALGNRYLLYNRENFSHIVSGVSGVFILYSLLSYVAMLY